MKQTVVMSILLLACVMSGFSFVACGSDTPGQSEQPSDTGGASSSDGGSSETVIDPKFIDSDTPKDALPANNGIGSGWKLSFSDEFNDGIVNTDKWVIKDESRGKRDNLGIKEWFFKPQNVEEKDGNLVLKVTKVGSDACYCSSVYSNGKYAMKYGYAEARIKNADIQKTPLTAFWLQSNNMGHVDGTGNDGAEIDIYESAYTTEEVISTIHIDGYQTDHQEKNYRYATPGVHQGYHTWGMLWDESVIKIYYDGQLKATFSDTKWIPRVGEYLYLSTVATFSGQGNFRDEPADSELTAAYFDYVRVWVK